MPSSRKERTDTASLEPDGALVQVDIAEHARACGIHLVDVLVFRVLVAQLVVQYLPTTDNVGI